MSKLFKVCLFASLAFFIGCSDSGKKVTRIDTNSVTDLSGAWNDTDSRLVAEEMINDCLGRPWYDNMIQNKGGVVPTVVIGKVSNKSHEHINIETFIKDMERSLINSGRVDFVANAQERAELRTELASQAGNATADTQKQGGQEIGADLMLTGTITSIIDQEGGDQVVYYQVDLELTDIQSHRKVWIGDKKIKKFISKNGVKL
ncbi:MAG: penicillin-binding protein activator LpoB [Fibrobacter sp.]|uniref:penicillin-binding protein activator LpoB n=1 Tax=Fibrobacter sp. TaxID=35828 RepID=UPI001B2AC1C1|nr:penicillin-binding protein activator LpoB [Fibrobacter sp.]MBO7059624.1 penicillin-binding protein activator LpoB [Fibrobacter sp.]MBR3670652.1 penicillin-binding protein activator LpoB [Fibrobacter sp.]